MSGDDNEQSEWDRLRAEYSIAPDTAQAPVEKTDELSPSDRELLYHSAVHPYQVSFISGALVVLALGRPKSPGFSLRNWISDFKEIIKPKCFVPMLACGTFGYQYGLSRSRGFIERDPVTFSRLQKRFRTDTSSGVLSAFTKEYDPRPPFNPFAHLGSPPPPPQGNELLESLRSP